MSDIDFNEELDPFDPLGISKRDPQPIPVPSEEPIDVKALDESLEPDLPEDFGKQTKHEMVKVEDDSDSLHIELREQNVPEDRRLQAPELKLPAHATAEQKRLIENAVKDVALYGIEASAMVCEGEAGCPYSKKCPILRRGVPVPVGEECPVEIYAMKLWMQAQLREMEVNPHNVGSFYDVVSSQAIVGLLLQNNRARWGESLNPLLEQTMEQITTRGRDEIVNVIKTGNYNTDYREKALKLIERFGKQNMQTRERKAALLKSGWKDKSKHAAEVSQRLAEVREVEDKIELDDEGMAKSLSRISRFKTSKADEDED